MEFLSDILGGSAGLVALRKKLRRVLDGQAEGRRPLPLFIQGETGTGKGLLARSIHRASARAAGPFVDVNCAAIPQTLLEAEMFGFERGAFTDARQAKPGLFEAAHRGTLFLDEISLLPEPLQAKLLKVIEERSVRRLGSTRSQPVDVWVIVASNEDMADALRARRFREDLYHRLAVVPVSLPPVRERGDDLIVLAEHFLRRACDDYGLPPKTLAPDAIVALHGYPWPGNVRELGNVMERVALLAESAVVTASMLGLPAAGPGADAPARGGGAAAKSFDDVMRERLHEVLIETGWNISRTAAALGITRNTVRARIERYALRPGDRRPRARLPRAEAADPAVASFGPGRSDATRPLRWESRRVTLLRIRLVASAESELLARRLLDMVRDKVLAFGGRIEGLSPTGLFAVFGSVDIDEPALRAAHAAIVLDRLARRTPGALETLGMKIGVHLAEMSVGISAGAAVLDAEGVREAWSVLEALLQEAEPGMIIATPDAASVLRRRFSLHALSLTAYRIEGVWRAQSEGWSQSSRFVGRREELALLESRFRSAVEGRRQVVDIVGDAGIGKSRLLREFLRRIPDQTLAYLEGRCLPFATTTPFFPLLSIVKTACGISESDSPDVIEGRVTLALEGLNLPTGEIIPYLVRLLRSEEGAAVPIPPALLARRVVDAIRALLFAQSARTTVLMVVEDLHWVDQASEACLDSLAHGLDAAPILLLFTYRAGYRPPWLGKSNVTELTLPPLLVEDSLALVQGVVSSESLAQRILSRGEGNPLFLEELSRAAVDHRASSSDPLPATIDEAIAARLDRLGDAPRALLNSAAVIGREIPLALLRHTVELDEDALEEPLAELQRGEFLYERRGRGLEAGYVFKHALVQEATYARVPAEERRLLHLRILDGIEQLYADRLTEQVEALAHHAVLGEARERAVRYLLEAGRRAAARSAPADAVGHFRRGLELLETLPESPERARQELELQVSLGINEAARSGFAAPEVGRIHQRARELCRRVEAGPLLLGALGGLWQFYYFGGDFATALDLAEQHRNVVLATGEMNRLCASYDALGYTAFRVGDLTAAREHLEEAVQLYDSFPRPAGTSLTPLDLGVAAAGGSALVLTLLGSLARAVPHAYDAIDRGTRLAPSESLSLAYAHTCASRMYLLQRQPKLAAEHAGLAIDLGEKHGYVLPVAAGRMDLGVARIALGNVAAGLELLTAGLARWRAGGFELDRPYWLSGIADGHRQRGDVESALGAVDEALAHIRRYGERVWESLVYRLRAEILLETSEANHERARSDLERALASARAHGARLFELRAAMRLHGRYAAEGRADESRAVLQSVVAELKTGTHTIDLEEAQALLDA